MSANKDRKAVFLKPSKIRKQSNQTPMNINLMTCPDCGTIYHWGTLGMGNCPVCANKRKEYKTRTPPLIPEEETKRVEPKSKW